MIAKGICYGCPVKIPCLKYAIEQEDEFGIWGGKTQRERIKLRRQWVAQGLL